MNDSELLRDKNIENKKHSRAEFFGFRNLPGCVAANCATANSNYLFGVPKF